MLRCFFEKSTKNTILWQKAELRTLPNRGANQNNDEGRYLYVMAKSCNIRGIAVHLDGAFCSMSGASYHSHVYHDIVLCRCRVLPAYFCSILQYG